MTLGVRPEVSDGPFPGDGPATALAPTTIRRAGRGAGHTGRSRRLDPVTTAHRFLLQILHGNTAGAHRPRVLGARIRPRARRPLGVGRARLRAVTAAAQPRVDTVGRWRGHRTRFVDGTGVSMPDTPDPARARAGTPSTRAGGAGSRWPRSSPGSAPAPAGSGTGCPARSAPTRWRGSPNVARRCRPATCSSGTGRSARTPTGPSSHGQDGPGCSARIAGGSSTPPRTG